MILAPYSHRALEEKVLNSSPLLSTLRQSLHRVLQALRERSSPGQLGPAMADALRKWFRGYYTVCVGVRRASMRARRTRGTWLSTESSFGGETPLPWLSVLSG